MREWGGQRREGNEAAALNRLSEPKEVRQASMGRLEDSNFPRLSVRA